ncbi:hypothetical protein SLEP1_g50692 [Rubroshorea leprosula]|uniref:Transcription repressor n=1 Tax=Rubroshorea leprosula TaxID=152421 RepID=A0AAV5M0V8_9ROSI|nr:hypothetical protein SLEP1_g50692 [Rubroshorea leprosula]
MPKKSLHDYLSKIKISSPNLPLSSSKRILSGCKHPKTLSFAVDNTRKQDGDGGGNEEAAATLADIDRFLLENFKSLYIKDEQQNEKKGEGQVDQVKSPRGILFESPRFVDPPPGLRGSSRFFVAPGVTGSLMEEARTSLTSLNSEDHNGSSSTSTNTTLNENSSAKSTVTKLAYSDISSNDSRDVTTETLPQECIAVLTYSPDPYNDFRRSMQEMVDARMQHQGKLDWDFMEELLLSYLNLNEKQSHRFIMCAYADLVTFLRQRERRAPVKSRRTRYTSERKRKTTRFEEET